MSWTSKHPSRNNTADLFFTGVLSFYYKADPFDDGHAHRCFHQEQTAPTPFLPLSPFTCCPRERRVRSELSSHLGVLMWKVAAVNNLRPFPGSSVLILLTMPIFWSINMSCLHLCVLRVQPCVGPNAISFICTFQYDLFLLSCLRSGWWNIYCVFLIHVGFFIFVVGNSVFVWTCYCMFISSLLKCFILSGFSLISPLFLSPWIDREVL